MEESLQHVPPNNHSAELTVLSSVITWPEKLTEIQVNLRPEHFYKKIHQEIFSAMVQLDSDSQTIDFVTLNEKLSTSKIYKDVGGERYLDQVAAVVPAAEPKTHVEILIQKAKLRTLIHTVNRLRSAAFEEPEDVDIFIQQAEANILQIAEVREERTFRHIKSIAEHAFEEIANAYYDSKETMPGIISKLSDLDNLTLGFKRGDMIILGARPSMGKTALALHLARAVCVEQKLPTALYSLEMPAEQLMTRFFSAQGKIDGRNLQVGKLNAKEIGDLNRALSALSSSPMFINDQSAMTLYDIRNDLRRMNRKLEPDKQKIELVIIDYLQLVLSTEKKSSEQERVAELSRGIKNIAREFQVPVICLSQLSRKVDDRKDKRPMLSDLRESGAIEQDADQVMFIHRPEYYEPDVVEERGKAEIIVAKNRNGQTGTAVVNFDKSTGRFQNLAGVSGN